MAVTKAYWQFWIDRGGTFTDVVARAPDGAILTDKLLSENPERYRDAAVEGIRTLLTVETATPVPADKIAAVKMGTTVATNALLERKGDRTVLVITKEFADQLRIAYQNRPDIFARHIVLPQLLYERVVEIDERVTADGEVLRPIDLAAARRALQEAHDQGIRAAAIVFMHGYRYTAHEKAAAQVAREIGFTQVSVSHEVSPLMKLVGRGDTTVVDAYLSPILRRYVDSVAADLGGTRLMFMQSNGGLVDARLFQGTHHPLRSRRRHRRRGRDLQAGGLRQDHRLRHGRHVHRRLALRRRVERAFETRVAGVRMRAPMMQIHTVAAGGGSILFFDGSRYRVGPEWPAPIPARPAIDAAGRWRRPTPTSCSAEFQPHSFRASSGRRATSPSTATSSCASSATLAAKIRAATGDDRSPEQVAEGFLQIAVANMANAIKEISIQRGYDVTEYTLCCFGGAGGQHACAVADQLGMVRVFLHPLAGVLSAYGMGLADLRVMREQAVESRLSVSLIAELSRALAALEADGRAELRRQGIDEAQIEIVRRVHLRYRGTDAPLVVGFGTPAEVIATFESAHRQRYGFIVPEKGHIVEAVSVEAIGQTETVEDPELDAAPRMLPLQPKATVPMWAGDGGRAIRRDAPLYDRSDLLPGDAIPGPAVIIEPISTIVIEPGWRATFTARGHLLLERIEAAERGVAVGTDVDAVMLEVFNNLFMAIAEEMGLALQNTASR